MKRHDNTSSEPNDFEGYPSYPSREDITNTENGFQKQAFNEEKGRAAALRNNRGEGDSLREAPEDQIKPLADDATDVTIEDINLLEGNLSTSALDRTDDDGELLNENVDALNPQDGLDIPGSEYDDANEDIGEEDEENNYYSLSDDKDENPEY